MSPRFGLIQFFLLVTLLVTNCNCYKILIVPLTGKSHVLQMLNIGEGLISRGHQVHILLPEIFNIPTELTANITGINVERYGFIKKDSAGGSLDYDALAENITRRFIDERAGISEVMKTMVSVVEENWRQMLTNNEDWLAKLDAIKFDISLVQSIFFHSHNFLIPLRLGIPWVTFTFFHFRLPELPSFIPARLSPFNERMSLWQRIQNTFYAFGTPVVFSFPQPPEEMISKFRKYGSFNSMNDLIDRSLLWLKT